MEALYTYVWCVEYYYKEPWNTRKIKKYFNNLELAQEFVDNYDNICNKDYGPVKWYGNSAVRPIVEKQLAIVVENNTYVVGAPIQL